MFIVLYNAYFLQPGFIANAPNRVLTPHLAPSSVDSKGIQAMYVFSQIPFNGSLFLETKSHNPNHDLKKKLPKQKNTLLIWPWCFYALTLFISTLFPSLTLSATLVLWLLLEHAKHIATQ